MALHLKPLNDQRIVITGASSGIGLATAKMAAAGGAAIILVARNEEALAQVVREIEQEGGYAAYVAVDMADEDAPAKIGAEASRSFGGFDTWVNDAAVTAYARMRDLSMKEHRRIFDVNYFGMANAALYAAEQLRESGGAIINIGSVLSDRAVPVQGPYSATKHAVKGFTDALRMELEMDEAPISVTLIKPTSIDTPYPEHARNYMGAPPRLPPPLYDPRLVADAILFACETARRQIYVGGGGLLISLAGKFAPRLTDLAMERIGVSAQQKRGDAGEPAARDNLYEPRSDGRIDGAQSVGVRRTSLLLQAQKQPLALPFHAAAAAARTGLRLASRLRPPRTR